MALGRADHSPGPVAKEQHLLWDSRGKCCARAQSFPRCQEQSGSVTTPVAQPLRHRQRCRSFERQVPSIQAQRAAVLPRPELPRSALGEVVETQQRLSQKQHAVTLTLLYHKGQKSAPQQKKKQNQTNPRLLWIQRRIQYIHPQSLLSTSISPARQPALTACCLTA